jgi:hypothetical protein
MKRFVFWVILIMTALLLFGCSMKTVEQMYCLPKRSQMYNNLQSAIDAAMSGLSYCAPLSGEHQQPVQMADLDGDGVDECLLFAKSNDEHPLRVLVFRNVDGNYELTDTVESNGSAFDQVEYVQMNDRKGVEVVIGKLVSEQVIRSLSVYSMNKNNIEQAISVNYTKFMTVDLDTDGLCELMVLRPGLTETDNGIVELYGIENSTVERSIEVNMSQPADKLKRMITGKLHDGKLAVYVASTVGDNALITDVYTLVNGTLTNVTFSNESGTSVLTMRNFYVYADDIDNDGVVELPSLMTMKPKANSSSDSQHQLIRWFAMNSDGTEVDKMYTFHNFVDGWYVQLEKHWASHLTVVSRNNSYSFYLWDEEYKTTEPIFTVYAFTGQDREQTAVAGERFVLYSSDSTVFAASMENGAELIKLTQDEVIYSFRLIQQDWKTGET